MADKIPAPPMPTPPSAPKVSEGSEQEEAKKPPVKKDGPLLVEAIREGYYNGRRPPGSRFQISSKEKLGTWMKIVGGK